MPRRQMAIAGDDLDCDPVGGKSGQGRLIVPDLLQNGNYRLEYWNTFTGQVIEQIKVTLDGNSRSIPVISHRVDLALKLKSLDGRK